MASAAALPLDARAAAEAFCLEAAVPLRNEHKQQQEEEEEEGEEGEPLYCPPSHRAANWHFFPVRQTT